METGVVVMFVVLPRTNPNGLSDKRPTYARPVKKRKCAFLGREQDNLVFKKV